MNYPNRSSSTDITKELWSSAGWYRYSMSNNYLKLIEIKKLTTNHYFRLHVYSAFIAHYKQVTIKSIGL